MARELRTRYAGVMDRVLNSGDGREPILQGDPDRRRVNE